MNSNFDICMKNWVKMINESTYSFNPDEDKQDKLDMQADDYQELQKDIDDYYKKAEDGKIEGNLTTEDDKSDETSTEEEKTEPSVDDEKKSDEKKPTGEAMSPDEILKQFDKKNEKLAAEQAQVAKNVKRVDILELYDDYVNADVIFADGNKKNMEFVIKEDELNDMFSQIVKIAKKYNKLVDLDDAAIAIIRKRIDPSDKLDWFYKPTNTNLDKWLLDQQIADEDALTTYDGASDSWANQMGLFMDDYGDDQYNDDDDPYGDGFSVQ